MKLFLTISAFLLTGGVMMIPSARNSRALVCNTICKRCHHSHAAGGCCIAEASSPNTVH